MTSPSNPLTFGGPSTFERAQKLEAQLSQVQSRVSNAADTLVGMQPSEAPEAGWHKTFDEYAGILVSASLELRAVLPARGDLAERLGRDAAVLSHEARALKAMEQRKTPFAPDMADAVRRSADEIAAVRAALESNIEQWK